MDAVGVIQRFVEASLQSGARVLNGIDIQEGNGSEAERLTWPARLTSATKTPRAAFGQYARQPRR